MFDMLTMLKDTIKKDTYRKYKFEQYSVYIDHYFNRYIESNDGNFHMLFCQANGKTFKWGKNYADNPTHCPFGNEIADIEITKACNGIRCKNENGSIRTPCPWCYKANTPNGNYMNFNTFRHIFNLLDESKTMTQIAFGLDAEASEKLNPDIWNIFDYCNQNMVTPNVTVADIDEDTANKLTDKCGAIAVSYYGLIDKNRCYDSVKLLTDLCEKKHKNTAINIHCLLSQETYDSIFELINDRLTDKRLSKVNAIVFLSLKQKGRGVHFNKISNEQFKKIVDTCFEKHISFGMDSCSCPKFLDAIKNRANKTQLEDYVESCESTLYSLFIDAYGNFFPCSFMEKEGEWKNGIDLNKVNNFYNEVWNNEKVLKWRNNSIETINKFGCNQCPFYEV